jgi:hypothetical protein
VDPLDVEYAEYTAGVVTLKTEHVDLDHLNDMLAEMAQLQPAKYAKEA